MQHPFVDSSVCAIQLRGSRLEKQTDRRAD